MDIFQKFTPQDFKNAIFLSRWVNVLQNTRSQSMKMHCRCNFQC